MLSSRTRVLANSLRKWSVAPISTSSVSHKDASQLRNDVALLNPQEAEQRQKLQEGYITVEGPSMIAPVTGVPEEHVKERRVRIFEPPKNCMQSGTDNIQHWRIEFDARERWENPLIGWSSSGDPLSNMVIQFMNKEDAIAHCEKNGWQWFVQEGTSKPMKPKIYGENYSWDRRTRVSTK